MSATAYAQAFLGGVPTPFGAVNSVDADAMTISPYMGADTLQPFMAAGRGIFAPTPPGAACTQIYGGPQQAVVTGTLAGSRVWARFMRRNGCEIGRWNRVTFLLAGHS